jgi:hypothetical protein
VSDWIPSAREFGGEENLRGPSKRRCGKQRSGGSGGEEN